MKRTFLTWILPLGIALIAAGLFATGFTSFLTGKVGEPVLGPEVPIAASAPRGKVAIVVLGDSLARGIGDQTGLGFSGRLETILKQSKIPAAVPVNLGVSGARTRDLIAQLESRSVRALIAQSNVVIVSIGGNDLWGEANDWRNAKPADPAPVMDAVLGRVADIVGTVRDGNRSARIFIIGLYNPFAGRPGGETLGALVTEWNSRLANRFANDPNITVVPTSDLFSHRNRLSFDAFHPGDEGYALIARRIADSL